MQAKELIQKLIANYPPDKAAGLDAEVQLNLTGDGGGSWVVSFSDGKLSAREGSA